MSSFSIESSLIRIKKLQKKYLETNQLKIWEYGNPTKNVGHGVISKFPIRQVATDQASSKLLKGDALNEMKKHKKTVLNECLNETLTLTNKLKEQMRILAEAGINNLIIQDSKEQTQRF